VHDRNRGAPIPLAADQPVAELVIHALLTEIFAFEPGGHALHRLLGRQARELTGVDQNAVFGIGRCQVALRLAGGRDDLSDRDVIFLSECKVALIVRRHGHDGARSVADENVIADIDRHFLAVERIDREAAERCAGLFLLGRETVDLALPS